MIGSGGGEATAAAGPQGSLHLYLDLQSGGKGHFEGALHVFGKDPLEGLLEERRVEGVGHHHIAPGGGATVSVRVCVCVGEQVHM